MRTTTTKHRAVDRGWFAEACRSNSRQAASLYDESIWSYRHRPATRRKRLQALTTTKERADLLYAWATGNLTLKGE